MYLLYANPLTLAFHYLLLFFGGKPLDKLHSMYLSAVKQNDQSQQEINSGRSGGGSDGDVFDFIIVGGGSAGSVLANRLSEESYSVLLLEAGGHPFPLTAVPAMAPLNLNNPNIDWCDHTVPQKHAFQALSNKGPYVNRGKILGGGSSLNYMIDMRGHPNDFNNWAEETNDSSWSYNNLLPYFKKMESYHGYFPDERFHGSEGPLHISSQSYSPLLHEWLEAGVELGYPMRDPNGEQTESFFPFDMTIKNGARFSTNQAYIYPAINRPNLHIRTYSHAKKVHFDDNNRAVGVGYFSKNRHHYAKATKEVILSAGAIGSPQILMLSGVGPEDQLKPRGIPIISERPVGQSLQDHPMVWVGPFVVDAGTGMTASRDLNTDTLRQYVSDGKGPFSSLGVVGGAIKSSSIASPGWPDIYMKMATMGTTADTIDVLQASFGVRPGVMQKYFAKDFGKDAFFVVAVLGLVKSRGQLKLRSDSPFDRLDIDPMYFSDQDDITVVMEGIKFALQIGQTEAFRKVGARLTTALFPGCEQFGSTSDDSYWECYMRQWTHTVWHFSCTNRMGKVDDPNAVVDSELRVIGTKNLRVVDASIMPKVTNANTNIPTIMIAEKAADMIRKAWKSE